MLLTIAAVLGVLWLLGLLTATTFGGLIHVLIVVAVIIVLINLFRGKRVV
ncbi:MAG: lmo0937 family membrane protein [Bacteroidales bacterium]|nr:lmo0937 family membrane protein [Bacteroidales bacterium]NLC50167.1 lmo0937 family membrane protein [Bacteroidales bacterium]